MAATQHPSNAMVQSPSRGRLAPSPTGRLHLGHARSFLLAWWQMRSLGGEIVLRMDDLDSERSSPAFEEGILEDLTWLGIDWDGPVQRQSERAHLYDEAVQALASKGLIYPCVCTRSELADARSAPHIGEEGPPYPGTCRGRFTSHHHALQETQRASAWRFRVLPGAHSFEDGCAGRYTENVSSHVGDFPVTRRDGCAAYQLAVVVDDATSQISHILRGDDLLSSTLRQIQLQEALGLPTPHYFHVPLVTDQRGLRLAKRHDSLSLDALRQSGISARSIVSWAATSAGLTGSPARTAPEWIERFSAVDLIRTPVPAPAWDRAP